MGYDADAVANVLVESSRMNVTLLDLTPLNWGTGGQWKITLSRRTQLKTFDSHEHCHLAGASMPLRVIVCADEIPVWCQWNLHNAARGDAPLR